MFGNRNTIVSWLRMSHPATSVEVRLFDYLSYCVKDDNTEDERVFHENI